jgi:hypothetical protein
MGQAMAATHVDRVRGGIDECWWLAGSRIGFVTQCHGRWSMDRHIRRL